jgi:hypothetical protein
VGSTLTLAYDTPTTILTAANTVSLAAFDALANQRVMFEITNNTSSCAFDLYIYDTANDRWIFNATGAGQLNPIHLFTSGGGTQFIDTRVLSYAGTYQIALAACNTMTSNVTLNAHKVSPDFAMSISPNGSPVIIGPFAIGQNAESTFDGTQGQRVSLKVESSDITGCNANVTLLQPGAETPSSYLFSGCIGFTEPVSLPSTATYTLFSNPVSSTTGSLTETLYNVDPDLSGSITVNGAPVTVTTTAPGQNAQYTFTGGVGQQITVHATGNSMTGGTGFNWGYVTIKLVDPNGVTLTSTWTRDANFNLQTQTLSVQGQYTIVVDPYDANVGTVTISVTNP